MKKKKKKERLELKEQGMEIRSESSYVSSFHISTYIYIYLNRVWLILLNLNFLKDIWVLLSYVKWIIFQV